MPETEKRNADERSGRPDLFLALAVFGLAVLVRVIYLLEIRDNPFFDFPIVDSNTYDMQAREIASGNWLGDEVFWQAPLYPYFLAILYRVFGGGYFTTRLVQVFLGGMNCVLAYLVGSKVFDRPVGIVSGLAMALCGSVVFFDSELLAPVLLVLLSLLLVYLMIQSRAKIAWWLMCGFLLGLLVVGHGLAALFFPAALIWMGLSLRRRIPAGRVLLSCLAFALGCSMPVGLVAFRNYVVGKDFVPISSNAGINFYIGNNPSYDYTVGLRPGLRWERLNREPLDMGITKHSQRSAFFYRKALTFITSHPGQSISLLLRKLYQFWNGNEVGRNQEMYPFRSYSIILRLVLWKYFLAFPFGLVGPLSLVGLWVSWRERKRIGLLGLFLLASVVPVVFFFVCARYRMPALPFLLMFACFFLVWVVRKFRSSAWKQALLPIIMLLLLCLFLNLGTGKMPSTFSADDYFALGTSCSRRGFKGLAAKYYKQALNLRPGYADPLYNLGNIYLAEQNYSEAIEAYKGAVQSEPQFAEASYNMGLAYSGMGDLDNAKTAYGDALNSRPKLVAAMLSLGDIYIRQENPDSAAVLYERALDVDPGNARARHNLAVAYYALGRYHQALENLKMAEDLGMEPSKKLYKRLKRLVEGL